MKAGQKNIFITGAFGGIGQATTQLLIKNGWHVFAGDQNPEMMSFYHDNPQLTPILMDIRDPESIEKAFEIVASKTTAIDALINMPGILTVGSLVELPLEELKKLMEINLYGMYAVNKQFLPLILEGKGRIINLSSEVGTQMAAPFNGFYAMSKHAVEAYSDALRRELAFLGIRVIKIQPGPIKTQMTKSAEEKFIEAEKASVLFKKHIAKGLPYLPKVYQNAQDAEIVARAILKAVNNPKPRIAYSVKKDKIRQMLDLLPVSWADLIIKKALS